MKQHEKSPAGGISDGLVPRMPRSAATTLSRDLFQRQDRFSSVLHAYKLSSCTVEWTKPGSRGSFVCQEEYSVPSSYRRRLSTDRTPWQSLHRLISVKLHASRNLWNFARPTSPCLLRSSPDHSPG
ncbi:hypothetical protein VTO42DRAFT_5448 [Malbranchea cinnamomea]